MNIFSEGERYAAVTEAEPVDAVGWVRKHLGFEPDANQAKVLSTSSKRGILNCSRQWGKSFIGAAKAVHQACTEAGSLTIVVSPSGRQSGELVRKAKNHAVKMGIRPKGDGDNKISILFPNGSRIVGLPGSESTIRGFSAVSLLLVDEASRVSDDLYMAIRPMLATTGGSLWMMSTPWGKRGFFYDTWAKGGDRWERISGKGTECSRMKPGHLDDERATMGDRQFRQEYLCEFSATVDSVFDRDMVERAMTDNFQPLVLA